MKLVDNKNTSWGKISKVILIVNSVEISYGDSFSIDLNCNFENISRGRCNLKISKKFILFMYTLTNHLWMLTFSIVLKK